MKLKVDKENDALYLRLDESEILDLSARVAPDMLKIVQLETV